MQNTAELKTADIYLNATSSTRTTWTWQRLAYEDGWKLV